MKGKHELMLNDSLIHTLYSTVYLWKQPKSNLKTKDIPILESFIICNNTIHDIYCRQHDTNETIHMESNQAFPFSWTNDCNDYPVSDLF